VKVAVGLTFLTAWVTFAEVVIDRQGLWVFMPFYHKGDPCLWDLGVAILIVAGLAIASRRPTGGESVSIGR